ncbi:MAG: PEP/pyruvate-binding domain-containing protein, partial [Nanoarchaeota archaeon]
MTDKEIKKVVYTCVVADLFHHGHLKALKFAKSLGDFLICGILTDEAVESYRRKSITDFEERKNVIENLSFVDRVIKEESIDATNSLKKVHEEFKDAKLIFVRLGDKWKSFPEYEYLSSIGGELIRYTQPNYISDYRILKNLLESYKGRFKDFEEFVNYFKVKDFVYYDSKNIKSAIISTKADTLRSLNPLLKHSSIEKPLIFTLKDWKGKKNEILQSIKKEFSPKLIIIRSSTFNEDTFESSMAGYFDTELNISSDDIKKVENSINNVINSYKDKSSLNELNQILIQPQTTKINTSGVVFTKTLENGAPYYTVNYDDSTGFSDTVTKGLEYKTLTISKSCNPKNYPHQFYKLINAIQEIEKLLPDIPLDIEFAINKDNQVIIFQVRPLIIKSKSDDLTQENFEEIIDQLKENFIELSKRNPHLFGDYRYFADMPDWNPAEIIGDRPNYLDYSLYDYVITDSIWHQARTSQGYYDVG